MHIQVSALKVRQAPQGCRLGDIHVVTDNDPEAPTPAKKVSKPRFDEDDARCHGEIYLLCFVDVVSDQGQERISATRGQA